MANAIYRNRLINTIAHVVREAADAGAIEHPGLIGRIREVLIEHLLTPMLPAGYEIGTGKIVNERGQQSAEIDLVIYSRAVLPPIMYSARDGVFPSQATYYAVEAKSRLSATGVRDSIDKGKTVIDLYDVGRRPDRRTNVVPTALVLFAFGSDLAEHSSELDRYAEYDPQWRTDPVLKAICVVGRGYWYHRASDNRWAFHAATAEHDEVIDIVSGIVNTLLKNPASQRAALLGHYLSVERGHVLIPSPDA